MNKYKNLKLLKEITKDMVDVTVPDFFLLGSEYFDLYTGYNDTELEKRLKEYFKEHIKTGGNHILRSSALHSEDSEVMGAGLYESKKLEENTFECFYDTVLFIYKSFYSEHAIAERERQGVKEDKMEIIIQDYVQASFNTYNNKESKGFANSILQGNKNVIQIEVNNHPILLNRDYLATQVKKDYGVMEEMFMRCDDSEDYRKFFHYPFDIYKVGDMPYITLGFIIEEIREAYGKEFQIEFAYGGPKESIYIYQIRPLPEIYKKEIDIEFPKEKELFSIPFAFKKEKTKVYPSHYEYSYENRFYITTSSHSASMLSNCYIERFIKALPEVICFTVESMVDHGHLQSLALQKEKLVLEACNHSEQIKILNDHQSVYIVADGKEMRFYENKEKEEIDDNKVIAFLLQAIEDLILNDKVLELSRIEHRYEYEFKNYDRPDISIYFCELQTMDTPYDIKYEYGKFSICSKRSYN